jgi:hypothetical protein
MFGDNTGYAAACRWLAEMLEHAGRAGEAGPYRDRAEAIQSRTDALCWNGRFFTHHVPEDPAVQRDLGVDETTQVSLSNAYSLNRGIRQEQCAAIIRTYQAIKDHLPPGSPGEWYTIYPPFPKGYGGHNALWQYMNASVTPIVAGELAHGAFQNGFEEYGADILRRLSALGKAHGGRFHCSYTGAFPPQPEQTYTRLDLAPYAAAPLPPALLEKDLQEPLPTGEVTLAGVPFCAAGSRTCLGLGRAEGLAGQVTLPVGKRAGALYLLHALDSLAPGAAAGALTLRYVDGSQFTHIILSGRDVLPCAHWMYLEPGPNARAAWRQVHPKHLHLQLVVCGLPNPHPERAIESVCLSSVEDGPRWTVLGLTLGDGEVYFRPGPISYGIPDNWGAAAVAYALVEGLAGVVDRGVAFDRVELAPRWSAAGVDEARVSVRYPASTGYLAYHYTHDPENHAVAIQTTGAGQALDCHVLLPPGARGLREVKIDGQPALGATEEVEAALYAVFQVPQRGVLKIEVYYD